MKRNILHLLVFLIFLITAFSCENPRSPAYFTFKGQKAIFNYSTLRGQSEDSLNTTPVIPAISGDLVAGEEFYLKVSGRQNKIFEFSDSSGHLRLEGHIYALNISDLSGNFEELDDNEMNKLAFLNVDEWPEESQFIILEKIAPHNRKLSINLSNIGSDTTVEVYNKLVARLLDLFDPPVLNCELNTENAALLAKEEKLELLLVSMDDTTGFVLPHIAQLKSLIFTGDSIGNRFLDNNPQVENLTIMDCSAVDTSMLSHITGLRSLVFPFCETLNLSPLGNMKKLNRLILDGDSVTNIGALKDLGYLRWLHFPTRATQSQFDSVTGFNEKLELAEISGDGYINDLSTIRECRSLKGLIFYGDTMKTMKGLNDLANLKYLSLPEDSYADAAYLAMMKKAFPKTTIVPNSGVCLGSGWILLLLPLVLVFHFFYKQKTVSDE